MANKRHIRLNDVRDVKKLMTKLINQRYREEVDTPVVNDIGFLVKLYLQTIELEGKLNSHNYYGYM